MERKADQRVTGCRMFTKSGSVVLFVSALYRPASGLEALLHTFQPAVLRLVQRVSTMEE
jgi:hypothetical protein